MGGHSNKYPNCGKPWALGAIYRSFSMNERLISILNSLKSDPSVVVILYEEIFNSTFFAIIQKGTESSLNRMKFLTYPTSDEVRELPIFSSKDFLLPDLTEDSSIIELYGQSFWEQMLEIIETGKCEIAINPGQPHGIRLTKEMIQGMILKYGAVNNGA